MTFEIQKLSVLLADTYTLYLKTQNYHWHVRGMAFKSLHDLFELQYKDLFKAIDDIAERMVMLGARAPATFKAFMALKTIDEGQEGISAKEMVADLAQSHEKLLVQLNSALVDAQKHHDEGTITLLSERILIHEKAHWMLEATKD
jgi:starvation-inducible DNA-binding protein